MKIKALLFIISISLISCKYFGHGEGIVQPPPNVVGLTFSKSEIPLEDTYTTLRNALQENPNITIVAEVDHTANANTVSLELDPTRIIFFGNPNLGTPLMQRNQLAGLDLPQKILVYKNKSDVTYLGFNNTSYLASRHGLEGVPTLPTIETALTNLTTGASHGTIVEAERSMVGLGAGIITKKSNQTFEDTYNSLRAALENNPNLNIFAAVDHEENASKNGLELNPTRLLIFGNPQLGTPLMQNRQTTALDLPQKMLIWEDENGMVHVSYNNPSFLVERHKIKGNRQIISTIANALDSLSDAAIGE
ncbi:DUF302 domain-containing protein [uncultured Kriegella sp.]|uniref:DUF302 domain-containing protein n=1 Tax=uncultured Kriegella sp. TaxID=1798910 RepID=UPI0030DB83A1|tara:strand:- start:134828 stop:135745 length:918 start_codon:yes stop_codon:yes gene_type:complete